MEFSDTRILKEIDRFIHGYSNRFSPVLVPTVEGPVIRMKFRGLIATDISNKKPEDSSLVKLDRGITWCDLIHMACVEMSKDKYCIVTRYPIDTIYNHYVTGFGVSSTKETEPIYYNTTFYPRYPKIRQEDIGTDTSNKFVDTLNLSNCAIGSMGADYDGDTANVKIPYTNEAIDELKNYVENSKLRMINFGASPMYECSKEAIQSLYSLTKVLSNTKLTDPEF